MNYEIGIPCMVQWCVLWFQHQQRRIEHWENKMNVAIVPRDHLEKRTHRSFACWHQWHQTMHRTHRKWEVNKEMEGWVSLKKLELLLFLLMTMKPMNAVLNHWNHQIPRPLSTQKQCTAYPFLPRTLHLKGKDCRKCKKTTAVSKRAMTEKRERWPGKDWYGRPKYGWQQSAGCDGGQSSHDMRDTSQPHGKWREISAEMDAVRTTVKEKTNMWNKSCKESTNRETKVYKMSEAAVIEKQEERERRMIRTLFGSLERRESENEARNLIQEMQHNHDESHNKTTKWNGRAVFYGNTSKLSTKNVDVHSSLWQSSGRSCKAEIRST